MRLTLLCLVFTACGGPSFVAPPPTATAEVTPGKAVLTWEDADNAVVTLIVRTPGDDEPVQPTGSGVVGDTLGTGYIIARFEPGTNRYVDNNLPEGCGPFAWHFWSRNKAGNWSAEPTSVRSVRGEHTLPPSAVVEALSWANEGDFIRLAWTPPPPNTGFVAATLTRRAGEAPRHANDGVVVYSGPNPAASERRSYLSTAQKNYYSIFNCNLCGRCGEVAPSVEVVPGEGPSLDLEGFDAGLSDDGRHVELVWESNSPTVRVLRGLNGAPAGPFDPNADVVVDGDASGYFAEPLTNLSPHMSQVTPQRYTYKAFACSGPVCGANAPEKEFSFTLRQALAGGGYSIFLHHGTALDGADKPDAGVHWFRSCDPAIAKQLSTSSANDISSVRDFFETSGASISKLYSSEFCRAVQTAEGLDAGVPVQLPSLNPYVNDTLRCTSTQSALNERPAEGSNIMIVGHGFAEFGSMCTNMDSMIPGTAVIYKPRLGANARYIGLVNNLFWQTP